MPITDNFLRLPIISILVDRSNRQRQELKLEDLIGSISKHGVLQPIIVCLDKNKSKYNEGDTVWLIAGERRLEASKQLGLLDIPARFLESLSLIEMQLIELEENIKRKDLSWQDQSRAVSRIHQLHLELDSDWTLTQTAEAMGLSTYYISANLRVEPNLTDPKIASATSCISAVNILCRRDQRAAGDALEDLLGSPGPAQDPTKSSTAKPNSTETYDCNSILLADFNTWIQTYSGPKFNIIHCDFPYGIEVFAGEVKRQMATDGEGYKDSKETYHQLLMSLCFNLDKIMTLSGHIFFWYSNQQLELTLDIFKTWCPDIEFSPFPLVWHKTDNSGVLGAFRHNPRHIYETCLFGTRNNRQLVEQKGDCYGCPIDKTFHPSTKPEPMLRHFLSMVVDQNSTLFDPTCGSGSALRAAESLGAKTVLGLEQNPDFHKNASDALRTFRLLRKTSNQL